MHPLRNRMRRKSILLGACIVALAWLGIADAQTQASDCAPFEQLYNQTRKALPWTAGNCCALPCTRGAPCFDCADGRVTAAILSNQGLTGSIPELSGVSQLLRLELALNGLTGAIPNLQRLPLLNLTLNGNSLSGRVDGILPNTIGTCQLTSGFTNPGLFNCTADVPGVCIKPDGPLVTGVSCPVTDAASLSTVECAVIEQLYFQSKKSFGWPGGKCCGATVTGPGNAIACDTNGRVTGITLASQNISGALPSQISSLGALTTLVMDNNQLTGSIDSLTPLTNLQVVILSRNRFSGALPASLRNLTQLTRLYLNDNRFSGAVPDMSNLISLKGIALSGNGLAGPVDGMIPSSVTSCYLDATTGLFLCAGTFPPACIPTGTVIPTGTAATCASRTSTASPVPTQAAGTLATDSAIFETLYSQSGKNIPWPRGNVCANPCPSVLLADKASEQRTPCFVCALSRVWGVYLNGQNLMGAVPDLGRMDQARVISMSGNRLVGPVPPSVGTLKNLQYLLLDNNEFSGGLPDLTKLVGLSYLSLDRNNISGSIDGLLPSRAFQCNVAANPGLYSCAGRVPSPCTSSLTYGGPTCPQSTAIPTPTGAVGTLPLGISAGSGINVPLVVGVTVAAFSLLSLLCLACCMIWWRRRKGTTSTATDSAYYDAKPLVMSTRYPPSGTPGRVRIDPDPVEIVDTPAAATQSYAQYSTSRRATGVPIGISSGTRVSTSSVYGQMPGTPTPARHTSSTGVGFLNTGRVEYGEPSGDVVDIATPITRDGGRAMQ